MTLEFEQAVKALTEHIELLKQELLFLTTQCTFGKNVGQEIITVKRELDKAVEEKMRLSQIYCCCPYST